MDPVKSRLMTSFLSLSVSRKTPESILVAELLYVANVYQRPKN